jgi:hypothetical protein
MKQKYHYFSKVFTASRFQIFLAIITFFYIFQKKGGVGRIAVATVGMVGHFFPLTKKIQAPLDTLHLLRSLQSSLPS